MEKSITIHRTAEEEPPKFGRFIVGRTVNGRNEASICRYDVLNKTWYVGYHSRTQAELAVLWPFWINIPDFDVISFEVNHTFTQNEFFIDEKLPDNFTTEDLVQLKYKTDIQRILRRILVEFGTEIDGKLLYPLTDEEPDKNIPITKQSKEFLTILKDKSYWEYEYHIPNEVLIYEWTYINRRYFCHNLPFYFRNRHEKQIIEKIKNIILRIQKDYPEIRQPHNYDPDNEFVTKIITISEITKRGWLTTRSESCLRCIDIHNIKDLENLSISKLKKTRNVGEATINDILNLCAKFGIIVKP